MFKYTLCLNYLPSNDTMYFLKCAYCLNDIKGVILVQAKHLKMSYVNFFGMFAQIKTNRLLLLKFTKLYCGITCN